jgi:hypothetical protein
VTNCGPAKRLDPSAEIETFTEAQAIEALDHISRTNRLICRDAGRLRRLVARQALINRIKDDATSATSKCA